MVGNDIDDFVVVTDDPFPLKDRDAKLYFDITWKSKTSKLIINCRVSKLYVSRIHYNNYVICAYFYILNSSYYKLYWVSFLTL